MDANFTEVNSVGFSHVKKRDSNSKNIIPVRGVNGEKLNVSSKIAPKHIEDIVLISFFCGAGGLDWGFKQMGFKTALALDFNADAVASFNHNFDERVAEVADIEKLGPDGILKLVREKVRVGAKIGVIGGPPCQGFSLANKNSSADDPRNTLPLTYLKVVRELNKEYDVQFILIENVSGIKAAKHSKTLGEIIEGISDLGFEPRYQELNAVDYGVPQIRKRMILLGLRENIANSFTFPAPLGEERTVREAIGQLPAPTFFRRNMLASEIPHHPNHWTMNPKSEKFSPDYVADKPLRSFKKVSWDLPSSTIAFGNREILVHPTGRRRLSILEAMLLQGFPQKFVLLGTLSAQVTQISNAVPPPMAKAIARSIKNAICGLSPNKNEV